MKVKINGEFNEVTEGITVMELIQSKNLNPNNIVIQLNLDILKKENWPNRVLKENDDLEILTFVGGG